MAKISHPNFVDTINDVLYEAKRRGVLMLESKDQKWRGDHISINNEELANFGTCGYLGLEIHPKVIQGAVEFAQNFGTQFSVSRTYLTSQKNKYLESLLSQIFNNKPVIAYTSTTLAHIGVLPIVVGHNDAIILDQQSHISIQNAAMLMSSKGVPIEIVRHSNMEMLEYKLKAHNDKCEKVWYMIDGVYSMYGDIAPINEINALMLKYPKLHLYVDDAHGMSWFGKNGCGRIYAECELNERTIYVSTLAKGFGTMGGIVVFPNEQWYKKVIIHGGPLAYSHPLPPPMMGASIASAEIHLSSEIMLLQKSMKEKLEYTKELIEDSQLPLVSNPETPIFFIGTGQPTVGYNLNSRILNDGYYVTIGIFPGVPVKNTGLRFTINNHLSKPQIKGFIDSLKKHYPEVLKEEGKTLNDVLKAFKMPLVIETAKSTTNTSSLKFEEFNSIRQIDKYTWNRFYYNKGNFDWDALALMERSFKGNPLKENNWDFYYILIRDENDEIILASFFSYGIFKDDMLSPVSVSEQIEKVRLSDPYYLCSMTLTMGSMFSEGDHLYINRTHSKSKEALKRMIDWAIDKQNNLNANVLMMRDFKKEDDYFSDIFHEESFFKLDMPFSNVIDISAYSDIQSLLAELSPKNKKNYKQEVLKYADSFEIKVKTTLSEDEVDEMHSMFLNVANRNKSLNIFPYPKKLITEISSDFSWEILCLYIKATDGLKLASVCFIHTSDLCYNPIFLGMNYDLATEFKVYKQLLFQITSRAISLQKKTINLGLSADTDKRKMGAVQIGKSVYISTKDSFNLELLNSTFSH